MKIVTFGLFIAAVGIFLFLMRPAPVVAEGTATPGPELSFQKLVDVGGHELFINCTGQGGPVVILEAGSGSDTSTWLSVPREIAKFTTVCVYDRAGVGKSQTRPKDDPVGLDELALDLHNLLVNTPIKMPVVLVGHSLGGAVVRIYGSMYPADVAGMVMVDGVNPDLLIAVLGGYQLKTLPDGKTTVDPQLFARDFQNAGPFPNIPLIVLSHHPGKMELPASINVDKFESIWQTVQMSFAELSPQGILITADKSGHFIQQDQPELVINAVRRVVYTVRNGKAAPTLTPFWTPTPTVSP